MNNEATAAEAAAQTRHEAPSEHYLNPDYGLKSWLLTTDHKRIGLLYLLSITLSTTPCSR